MLENTGVELQEWDWWHKKDRVDALLRKMSSERRGCGMGRWTRLQNENNQFLKSWELTFVDLSVRQLECFISPFQRLGRGGRTVQHSRNLRGAERNEFGTGGAPQCLQVFFLPECVTGEGERRRPALCLWSFYWGRSQEMQPGTGVPLSLLCWRSHTEPVSPHLKWLPNFVSQSSSLKLLAALMGAADCSSFVS